MMSQSDDACTVCQGAIPTEQAVLRAGGWVHFECYLRKTAEEQARNGTAEAPSGVANTELAEAMEKISEATRAEFAGPLSPRPWPLRGQARVA
jgi:hypothetical protein